jgi:hypothetical protein
MTKRIEKLAKQATIWEGMENGYIFDKEKFAKLIIKECAKVAYECGPTVVHGSERQFNPITYTGNQILIHFGVEE